MTKKDWIEEAMYCQGVAISLTLHGHLCKEMDDFNNDSEVFRRYLAGQIVEARRQGQPVVHEFLGNVLQHLGDVEQLMKCST